MTTAQERNPVVVIVDDDPAILSSLAFSLRTEGIAVRPYPNGSALLDDLPPAVDCLVIDYKLPGLNGLDLLAALRHRGIAAPAILITTHPSTAVRERATASGAALVEKPLLGDALFQQIHLACAAAPG